MKFVKTIDELKNSKNVFVWIYMEGCGPCNQIREAWTVLQERSKNDNTNAHAIDINIQSLPTNWIIHPNDIDAFPSLRHIHNGKVTNLDNAIRTIIPLELNQRTIELNKILSVKQKTRRKKIDSNRRKITKRNKSKHVKSLSHSRFHRVQ
jgi:hypothetical protein